MKINDEGSTMKGAARRLALLWAVTGTMGCSLLLNPDCGDDSECSGGVCKSGVCESVTSLADEGVDGATDATLDMTVEDMSVELDLDPPDTGPTPDMMPDARPPAVAPTCEFETPREDVIQNSDSLEVSLVVTDADTPLDQLDIRLDASPIAVDAMGLYTGAVALSEGPNTVVLTVVDPDGERCEARVEAIADLTTPVVTLQRRSLTNNPDHRLRGDVTDDFFEDNLLITVDGQEADVVAEFDADAFEVVVPLGDDGEKALCVTATDRAGNTSEPECYTIRLDTSAPVVTLTAPRMGAITTEASILVEGQVSTDGSPESRSSVRVLRPAGGGRTQADVDGRFDFDVNVPLGETEIEICGDDEAGNEGCATVRITREDPRPCVEIERPIEGAVVGQEVVVVSGTVCPAVDRLTLQVGDGPRIDGQIDAGRFVGQVALPAAGAHRIVAEATANEQTAQDAIELLYDATGPDVRISQPAANTCTNDVILRFSGTALDAESEVAELTVSDTRLRPSLPVQAQLLPGGSWAASLQPDEGADITFEITATNVAGIQTSQTLVLSADRTGPTINLDFEERDWFALDGTGKVVLTGSLLTEICGARSLSVGGRPVVINPDGGFRYSQAFEDGAGTVRIEATDLAGNITVSNPGFRVDSRPPTINGFSPVAEAYVPDVNTEISAEVTDQTPAGLGESGLSRATIDGVDAEFIPSEIQGGVNTVASIARTVAVPEGRSCYTFTAVDAVGNDSESTLCLRRDTTPPVVTIDTPGEDAWVPSPTIVTGTFDDGEFGSGTAEITVNGVTATLDRERGTWRAVGVMLPEGVQTLTVTAVDEQGNGADPAATRAVEVREFGGRSPAEDGLDQVSDVSWMGVADFNGDDLPDIVAVSSTIDGGSAVYLQRDDGTFGARGIQLTGLRQDIAYTQGLIGDFNQDGQADLVLVGQGDNGIFLGDGRGGFARQAQAQSNIPANSTITGVAAGDLNRDGRVDLVLFARASSRVLLATGDGGFQPEPLANLGLETLTAFDRGVIADLNDDAVLDLLGATDQDSSLFFGARAGGFDPAGANFTGTGATFISLVDGNRDGALDVFVDGGQFHLATGGAFQNASLGIGWGATSQRTVFGDFDGDTREDAITIGTDGLQFWRGAVGDFVEVSAADLGLTGAGQFGRVIDIDNDGDLDLLVGGPTGIQILRNNRAAAAAPYDWIKLDIRRVTVDGGAGPADAIGANIIQRDAVNGPYRALVANPFGATLVTSQQLETDEFIVRFVDLDAIGGNEFLTSGLQSGQLVPVFGRE